MVQLTSIPDVAAFITLVEPQSPTDVYKISYNGNVGVYHVFKTQ